MKKIKKYAENIAKTMFLFMLFYYAVAETQTVQFAVSEAVSRCINIIIPSLYIMMAVSDIIIKSGAVHSIAGYADKPARLVFKMNGIVFFTFIFSMFAGYPVGAKMINELYLNKQISRQQAEIYIGLCYGAGPAFIFGCISVYGVSMEYGVLIIISNMLANILLAVVTAFFMKKSDVMPTKKRKFTMTSDIICTSSSNAGRGMFSLCTMILFFSVICEMLINSEICKGLINSVSDKIGENSSICTELMKSVLDISYAVNINLYSDKLLPIISGCIAFGGACVIMQIKSILNKDISIKKVILLRAYAAVFSYIICSHLMPVFIDTEISISTSAQMSASTDYHSPSAAIMLIFMTFILINEVEQRRSQKQGMLNSTKSIDIY